MKMRKAALAVACAGAIAVGSVAATVAYLTDTEAAVNTFTVGSVQIHLDEVDYDDSTPDKDRDAKNAYKLLPGHTYAKDPTVTVLAGSEDCYVRAMVTVSNYDALLAGFGGEDFAEGAPYVVDGTLLIQYLVDGWDPADWEYVGCAPNNDGTATYEFRYKEAVDGLGPDGVTSDDDADVELPALFTDVAIPGTLGDAAYESLNGVEIDVIAHAIQAAGFADANAAWAQWK